MNPIPFHLLPAIRMGYFSAVYFNRAKQIAQRDHHDKRVTMQIFQKNDDVVVCGIKEVIELLKAATGKFRHQEKANRLFTEYISHLNQSPKLPNLYYHPNLQKLEQLWIPQYDDLTIHTLSEGSSANSWETVMHIEGPYGAFAHLESLYLGILSRRTKVATNTRRVVESANGKTVLFFADRFDHFLNQPGDGYAAKIGGADAVCTDAMGSWIDKKGMGTIPHALIALFDGNTIEATVAFNNYYPNVPLIALVDFNNDCPKTSVKVAKTLGKKLWGVRLDTATTMVDLSLVQKNQMGEIDPRGVNPTLVKNVRKALDKEGFKHVKVIVSGGFNPDRIRYFEQQNCPVDAYGVGSYLVNGNIDYTADVVKVEGKPLAKAGRCYHPNHRLKRVFHK